MKKLYYLIVLTLILGLVLTGCLSNISQVPATNQSGITYLTKGGPTEAEAESFPLFAGQDMLVGEVLVWNNDIELCVKYQLSDDAITDNWLLTETHLAVATTIDGIPQTKTHNPIPGKFPYGDDNLGGVEFSPDYCIPFEEIAERVECGGELFIAAHAVVQKCETESFTFNPELTWSRSSELDVAVFPGYGAKWTQAEGFTIPHPLIEVWDGGTLGQYFTFYSTRGDISWASWACTQPGTPSTTGTDLHRFNATFNIPAGYNVTGGTLGSVNPGYEDVIPMNDNIYIFVNEKLLFWGGTIKVVDPGTTHFLGMERRDTEPQDKPEFPETDGWHMDGTFPAIPSGLFTEGSNQLDVFAEDFWTGGGMHELGLTLQVEQTTCETESAWAGTEEGKIQFPGKNWATYFTYTVEPVLLETLIVDSAVMAGSDSVNALDEGKCYNFKVIGTWMNRGWEPVDAEFTNAVYTSSDDWLNVLDGPSGYDIRLLNLQVNEEDFVDWGEYSIEHIYYLGFLGTGSTVNFRVFDGDPGTNTLIPGWYDDNVGSLTVEIYLVP